MTSRPLPQDPTVRALIAQARRAQLNRRTFMAGAGASATALALAACSGGGGKAKPSAAADKSESDKTVNWANWAAYIDEDDSGNARGKGTTIDRFQKETGIHINYLTDFNDNDEYFNRSFSPMLGRGKPIAADIVAPTYWMAARLVELGWLEKLPLDRIPNHKNLEDAYLDLSWDPGATSFMVWQAGIGGIAYDPDVAGREIKSANDLFDPAFKGKIAMLTEMRDSVGLTMFGPGLLPIEHPRDHDDLAPPGLQQVAQRRGRQPRRGRDEAQHQEVGEHRQGRPRHEKREQRQPHPRPPVTAGRQAQQRSNDPTKQRGEALQPAVHPGSRSKRRV